MYSLTSLNVANIDNKTAVEIIDGMRLANRRETMVMVFLPFQLSLIDPLGIYALFHAKHTILMTHGILA